MTDPVLTFITSLRHPTSTDDYADVERLFGESLLALNAQTDRRFDVVAVANQHYEPPPGLDFAVRPIVVGFPPLASFDTIPEKHAVIKVDKGTKLAVALAHARGDYVMVLDCDDFVRRDVVDFVARHGATDRPGWYVDKGIRYDVSNGLFRPQGHFNDVCGTSLIWRRDLLSHTELRDDPTQQDVLDAFRGVDVLDELGSHRVLRTKYGLAPLPHEGAAYAVNNGRNMSGHTSLLFGLPIGRRRAARYGITRPLPSVTRRAMRQQFRLARMRQTVATFRANAAE